MDILLIAGLWLDGSVWRDVARALEADGHRAVPITLPGQGDGNTSATLADQQAAVIAAVDAAAERPMLVGHSAACTLAWLGADSRPDKVAKVALIGGFPAPDGERYADFFPMQDGAMPFPGWGRSRARTPPTWTTPRSTPWPRLPFRFRKASPGVGFG
jgi:pimeloyl-ACP methyl ester carboxylesterase